MQTGVVLILVIAAVLVVLSIVFLPSRNTKRFGLKEAEAAARYVDNDTVAASAVKGVVVGVLGYQDAIAEDISSLSNDLGRENAVSQASIEANEEEIERLEQSNQELDAKIEVNLARAATAGRVAALFG